MWDVAYHFHLLIFHCDFPSLTCFFISLPASAFPFPLDFSHSCRSPKNFTYKCFLFNSFPCLSMVFLSLPPPPCVPPWILLPTRPSPSLQIPDRFLAVSPTTFIPCFSLHQPTLPPLPGFQQAVVSLFFCFLSPFSPQSLLNCYSEDFSRPSLSGQLVGARFTMIEEILPLLFSPTQSSPVALLRRFRQPSVDSLQTTSFSASSSAENSFLFSLLYPLPSQCAIASNGRSPILFDVVTCFFLTRARLPLYFLDSV